MLSWGCFCVVQDNTSDPHRKFFVSAAVGGVLIGIIHLVDGFDATPHSQHAPREQVVQQVAARDPSLPLDARLVVLRAPQLLGFLQAR